MSKVLDSWVGRTRIANGERQFEIKNGVWRSAHDAVSNLSAWERFRRWATPRPRLVDPLLSHPEAGGFQGWGETLHGLVSDGTQISNTTSETIVCPDFNIPAYYMAPGRILRLTAWGVMSNVVTTPGTLTLRVRWGGVAGTVLLASAAQGLDTTARTNSLWRMVAEIVCRAEGSSGSFMSGGLMWGNVLSSTAANLLPALLGSAGTPLASGNVAVTVDTTAAKLLSVTGQFSVSTNPTNLTCQGRVIEALN